tara:strand:- start:514 stop:1179 length:666 start_codon:yes stop_codon:yes gene_type:complete
MKKKTPSITAMILLLLMVVIVQGCGQSNLRCLEFTMQIDAKQTEPYALNEDQFKAELKFATTPHTDPEQTKSYGLGNMKIELFSRAPKSLMGKTGLEENPFKVDVSSYLDLEGNSYQIGFTPLDVVIYRSIDGRVYGKGSNLKFILENSKYESLLGSGANTFVLPLDVEAGQSFPFPISTTKERGTWFVGEGKLNVNEVRNVTRFPKAGEVIQQCSQLIDS